MGSRFRFRFAGLLLRKLLEVTTLSSYNGESNGKEQGKLNGSWGIQGFKGLNLSIYTHMYIHIYICIYTHTHYGNFI